MTPDTIKTYTLKPGDLVEDTTARLNSELAIFMEPDNFNLIYCKKLSKLVPQEAWNEINSTCQSGFVKKEQDLFDTTTERKEQNNEKN